MVSPSKLSAQDSWTTFSLVQQPLRNGPHTSEKLPAAPRGRFCPTIPQQDQHESEYWRGTESQIQHHRRRGWLLLFSSLTGRTSNFSQAQERHYCIRNTDSHFHIALLMLKFDTKTSWSHPCQYPEKKIPLKPLQHLVFIDPHVPPPCWALWLARP